MHAISITRYGRPGGHVRDRAARSRSGHGRSSPRLAVGGVTFAGIAARTTPLPGWLLAAVMGVAGKGNVAGPRRGRPRLPGRGRLVLPPRLPRRASLASGRSAAQIADPLVERGPEVVGPAGRLENRHAALDARQKGGGPVLDVQIGRQVPGGLQGPDAGGQACLPPVHQLDHYGPGARGGAAQVEEQRPERALIALLLVTIDHHVPPLLPRVPGVQAPEIGLLVLQDLVCLVLL